MEKSCKCGGLCAGSFGISLGLISGIFLLLFAWTASWWQYGQPLIDMWSTVYIGYSASIKGGLIGLGWGILGGFVFGILWGWIYNGICCGCKCKRCKCCKGEEVKPLP